MVVRRTKDNRSFCDRRVCAELPNQLVPVHGWHEDIGNDQIGMFGSCGCQGLRAIRGLKQNVAAMAKQHQQKLAIRLPVVDNQDGRHC